MNKQGFTLVELLAIILIISMIIAITTFSVSEYINSSKQNISKIQIKNIENAAYDYVIATKTDKTCINLNVLVSEGYLNSNKIIDSKTKKQLKGSVEVLNNNGNYSFKYLNSTCKD